MIYDKDFHDSTVEHLSMQGDTLVMRLDMVCDDEGGGENFLDFSLKFLGVFSIKIDGVLSSSISSEFDDGEILQLDDYGGCVEMGVRWNNYADKVDVVRKYEFGYKSVEINQMISG